MQENNSTNMNESQMICPLLTAGIINQFCKKEKCAIWDNHFRECGILGIGDSLERIVDLLIDRSRK